MRSPRYTILIANRNTGAVRRLTITRRVALAVFATCAFVPLLIGLGMSHPDPMQIQSLQQTNENLRQENDSYRAATGQLADEISSLQGVLDQLDSQTQLDPATKAALDKLPAVIRARAVGGASITAAPAPLATESTESTFGVLKDLLGTIESRVTSVKTEIDGEQALARATPSIWPLAGWLSSGFGVRKDPIEGDTTDFHPGLDIAADKGTPVHATADGTVTSAGYNGNYGNSVLIDHGYGISTRFGHMSRLSVSAGQQVHRGDVVGYVGMTGRATAPHLHYEILLNGEPINPLRLLAKP